MPVPFDYQQRIKTLRRGMRLKQPEFAALVGVSPITISRWENGQNDPTELAWARIEELESLIVEMEILAAQVAPVQVAFASRWRALDADALTPPTPGAWWSHAAHDEAMRPLWQPVPVAATARAPAGVLLGRLLPRGAGSATTRSAGAGRPLA